MLLLAGAALGGYFLLRDRSAPSGGALSQFGGGSMTAGGGRDIVAALGEGPTDAREQGILDAVDQGHFVPIDWIGIDVDYGGHMLRIFVASDSLRIGHEGDSVRVSVRHGTAQTIADRLGAVLPTSRLSDLAWEAAETVLRPVVMPADARMASTSRMIAYSEAVDREKAAAGGDDSKLCRTVGKDWVTTERLLTADGQIARPASSTIGKGGGDEPASANFGWHVRGAPSVSPGGQPVLQSVGLAHDMRHVDYSQTVQLCRADCLVDGRPARIVDVMRDPALAFLVSDEVKEGTACRVTRHPAVAEAIA